MSPLMALCMTFIVVIGEQLPVVGSFPESKFVNDLQSLSDKDNRELRDSTIANNPKDKVTIITPRELQLLLADPSRFLLNSPKDLKIKDALLYRDDKPWTLRARRYDDNGDQSFLRFGRLIKRPKEPEDTAFLRFGRSKSKQI